MVRGMSTYNEELDLNETMALVRGADGSVTEEPVAGNHQLGDRFVESDADGNVWRTYRCTGFDALRKMPVYEYDPA